MLVKEDSEGRRISELTGRRHDSFERRLYVPRRSRSISYCDRETCVLKSIPESDSDASQFGIVK